MKIHIEWRALRLIMLLVWGIFALILTTQSDRVPLVHLMTSTIGSTDFGDSMGHAGLFGMLAVVAYFALSLRLPLHRSLLLAMSLALMIGTSTELFQLFVADRATSLSDMLANWLGVFVVGFAISFLSSIPRNRNSRG
ncbi:MAG: VanZ family protein [Chloroflexota bacterium]